MYELRRTLNTTVTDEDYRLVSRLAHQRRLSRAAWLRIVIETYLRSQQQGSLAMPLNPRRLR